MGSCNHMAIKKSFSDLITSTITNKSSHIMKGRGGRTGIRVTLIPHFRIKPSVVRLESREKLLAFCDVVSIKLVVVTVSLQ
nr:hypothetical protein [Tanacetum cinerariifolium]